jgi:hypothetical protein
MMPRRRHGCLRTTRRMFELSRLFLIGPVVLWLLTAPFAVAAPAGQTETHAAASQPDLPPAFPWRLSANNRYLIDHNGTPVLILGDAPQTILARLTVAEATAFIENRRAHGISALWINLLSNDDAACSGKPSTVDGMVPFTNTADLAAPDPAYFDKADEIIRIAAANRMAVLLDPIETTCWLGVLRTNGVDKAIAYGRYLGARYAKFPNIIWLHGNDFAHWRDPLDNALVQAVARGIRAQDPDSMHTVELFARPSLDARSWAPLIQIDAVYTYVPTFAQTLTEYSRADFKPIIMLETDYEFEHIPGTDGGSLQNLRRQGYWTMLSGAAGYVYGSRYSWRFDQDWQSNLDSPGMIQLDHLRRLLANRRWYDLVPDKTHSFVTAGYSRLSEYSASVMSYLEGYVDTSSLLTMPGRKLFSYMRQNLSFGSVAKNDYVAAAIVPDGTLGMAYLPSVRTITVDLSRLSPPVCASWFDPTNGAYAEIEGSPFSNTADRPFTPSGNNSAGDGDWVLLLWTPQRHPGQSMASTVCDRNGEHQVRAAIHHGSG